MNAREAAYRVLWEIEEGAFANLALDEFLRREPGMKAVDKGFLTELVYGTVKHRTRLDWLINATVKKVEKLALGPRLLLRLSYYQLLFMDRVPAFAVTNEAVKLARKLFNPGVASLINGVLRNYLRRPQNVVWPDREKDPLTYLEVIYSHPRWMLERWLKRYGWEDTVRLCEYNNAPAELWIRANTLRCTPEELAERLTTEGCAVKRSRRVQEGLLLESAPSLAGLSSFGEGLFTVQDESSMLVAYALRPEPGAEALDLCAGPGGKTTHLAQMMQNQGVILACDLHEHRTKLIEENARRLGVTIIQTLVGDASILHLQLDRQYPYVLVDAPCSGLGVLRRRPDARWRKKPEEIKELAALQQKILASAYQLLAPGGRLVYSTCTLEPEENTEVMREFLQQHPDLSVVDLTGFFPYEAKAAGEKAELRQGQRQFLPFRDGMEGFFIAAVQKRPAL